MIATLVESRITADCVQQNEGTLQGNFWIASKGSFFFFTLLCYVKLVYSEAILVNYPNSVKLEFLQGDARFHLKFIYNLLGGEAVVFRILV